MMAAAVASRAAARRRATLILLLAVAAAAALPRGAAADGGAVMDQWLLREGCGSEAATKAAIGTALARAKKGDPKVIDFDPTVPPCVTDPTEYKELFAKREVRCTSGLLTRLSAFTPGQVSSSSGYEFNWYKRVGEGKVPPSPFSEAEKRIREGFVQKATAFMGTGDQPAKYLAVGNPEAPRGTLTTISNAEAFLEQLGFALSDADISQVGVLMVMKDPAQLAARGKYRKGFSGKLTFNGTTFDVRGSDKVPKNNKKWSATRAAWPKAFTPTWANVVAYLKTYSASLGLALDGDSNAVVTALASKGFVDLTGCAPLCVFEDLAFPDVTGANTFPPATTPVRAGTVLDNDTCIPSTTGYPSGIFDAQTVPDPFSPAPKPQVPRLRRLDSDSVDPYSSSCSPVWKAAATNSTTGLGNKCPSVAAFLDGNLTAIFTEFAARWNADADATNRAILVRALMFQGCMGTYNLLFSGNGLTYTGTGGFFAPLGAEVVMQQMTTTNPVAPIPAKLEAAGTQGGAWLGCGAEDRCYAGIPYVGGPCTNITTGAKQQEGLVCDARAMAAEFMPLCFNGNTPQTDASKYKNNDPNYACWPDGRRCSDGSAQCCSPHCSRWQNITSLANGVGFVYALDRQCEGASPPAGCVPGGGNCRRCRLVGDADSDPSFPVCPACLCNDRKLPSALCLSTGYS